MAYAQPPGTDGLAIAALIVGILSIPGALFYGVPGIVLGALAIVFGFVARGRIVRSEGRVGGQGLATAGWITGICGAVIGVAFIVLIIVVLISFSRSNF